MRHDVLVVTHIVPHQELELERKRYNESAEALTRNQEDLRKREVKIASLEKENETMKKKMADLEEDLRVRILLISSCVQVREGLGVAPH